MILCSACSGTNGPRDGQGQRAAPFQTVVLDDSVPDGLSGLARDRHGQLWAVAETAHTIVPIGPNKRELPTAMKVQGVPSGLELEAMTLLDDEYLVLGTESEQPRRALDTLLFATRSGGAYQVTSVIEMPYGMWNLECPANQGIEAVCAARHFLVVAGEAAIVDNAGRAAPLGIYDRRNGTWRASRVELTSNTGKLSGLACRPNGEDIEVIAIERHMDVRRVLHWVMSGSFVGPVIESPRVLVDITDSSPDNIEGIDWTQDGSIALIVDNYFRGQRTSPGKLLVIDDFAR